MTGAPGPPRGPSRRGLRALEEVGKCHLGSSPSPAPHHAVSELPPAGRKTLLGCLGQGPCGLPAFVIRSCLRPCPPQPPRPGDLALAQLQAPGQAQA